MEKIIEVLEYLSKKEWYLKEDYKKIKEYLEKNAKEKEDIKSIKRYNFIFNRPLFFEHDLTTYKTGRIFAKYVLLPNKPILDIKLKELIVPQEDYVFVSFDFSGSQIRHLAVYKGLEKIKEIFEKDLDIYEEFAKETKIEKSIAKIAVLTLTFGGTKRTLKKNFPLELSEEDIERLIETYEKWFESDIEDYENNVKLNHKIQRLEVEFMKKKLIRLYEKQGKKFKLHAFIHDDIICEVHKDNLEHIEKIKNFLEKSKDIKMRVKVKKSNTFQFK